MDRDGSETMSKIVVIQTNNAKSIENTLTLSPVPTDKVLNLSFANIEAQNITIEIVNVNGQVVLQQNQWTNVGQNQLSIDLSELQSATYFIHITNESRQTNVSKMFIKK